MRDMQSHSGLYAACIVSQVRSEESDLDLSGFVVPGDESELPPVRPLIK